MTASACSAARSVASGSTRTARASATRTPTPLTSRAHTARRALYAAAPVLPGAVDLPAHRECADCACAHRTCVRALDLRARAGLACTPRHLCCASQLICCQHALECADSTCAHRTCANRTCMPRQLWCTLWPACTPLTWSAASDCRRTARVGCQRCAPRMYALVGRTTRARRTLALMSARWKLPHACGTHSV